MAPCGWPVGTQVDLTARLREILVSYPEGTSIIKELVQVGGGVVGGGGSMAMVDGAC